MTDKHIPASKLEALKDYEFNSHKGDVLYIKKDDLRALINEAPEVEPLDYVHNMPGAPGFTVCVFKAERVPCGTPIYLSPPPSTDLTKLVGELVEALESSNKELHNWDDSLRIIADFTGDSKPARKPIQKLINENKALLTRAKEYLK